MMNLFIFTHYFHIDIDIYFQTSLFENFMVAKKNNFHHFIRMKD